MCIDASASTLSLPILNVSVHFIYTFYFSICRRLRSCKLYNTNLLPNTSQIEWEYDGMLFLGLVFYFAYVSWDEKKGELEPEFVHPLAECNHWN